MRIAVLIIGFGLLVGCAAQKRPTSYPTTILNGSVEDYIAARENYVKGGLCGRYGYRDRSVRDISGKVFVVSKLPLTADKIVRVLGDDKFTTDAAEARSIMFVRGSTSQKTAPYTSLLGGRPTINKTYTKASIHFCFVAIEDAIYFLDDWSNDAPDFVYGGQMPQETYESVLRDYVRNKTNITVPN